MPVVHAAGIAIGLLDQQVDTIGVSAPDQTERCPTIAVLSCKPTMCEQFEASVIALDHDQRFPDLTAVLQKELIV
jgi:hypothetical protein